MTKYWKMGVKWEESVHIYLFCLQDSGYVRQVLLGGAKETYTGYFR